MAGVCLYPRKQHEAKEVGAGRLKRGYDLCGNHYKKMIEMGEDVEIFRNTIRVKDIEKYKTPKVTVNDHSQPKIDIPAPIVPQQSENLKIAENIKIIEESFKEIMESKVPPLRMERVEEGIRTGRIEGLTVDEALKVLDTLYPVR